MKTNQKINTWTVKGLIVIVLLALANISVFGQLPNDSSLRLWLKADAAIGTTQDQTFSNILTVPVWTSSDSYGTVFTVPPLPSAYDFNDQSNHTPQLITVTNNGLVFPTLWFRQANDPVAVPVHNADRLWQTNNLDANDPTLIDPTNDITLISVISKTPVAVGAYPCVMAKRSSGACPYEYGYNEAGNNQVFITYAGSTVYPGGNPVPTKQEFGIVEMTVTATGVLSFRQYFASQGGWSTTTTTGVARGSDQVGDPFTISCHTQGANPPDDVLGGGAYERFTGYFAEAALYNRILTSTELAAAEQYLLLKYFASPGLPVISGQPQSQSVQLFNPVTFKVVVGNGTPPYNYQWLNGVVPIPGETNFQYTIPSVTSGGTFSVIVSNNVGSVTSSNATLTTFSPTNKPTILTALLDYTNRESVTITYSEIVSSQTATNTSNYTINNGVTIIGATAITNANNPAGYISAVILTTGSAVVTAPSILNVKNVQDRYNNVIATNYQATIPIPEAPGTPPSANQLLWLAADNGLLFDNLGVYQWSDLSAGELHDAFTASWSAIPQVTEIAFPNGLHPAVVFAGANGMIVNNQADFNLQQFTIYLVGDTDNTKTSDDFIGNWPGYVLGGSDSTPGAQKWSTLGTPGGVYQPIDPTSGRMGNRVPLLIEATYNSSTSNQVCYFNGANVGTYNPTTLEPIDYSTARGLTIGNLFSDSQTQPLIGDIQEILIYSTVSQAQDAAVKQYIINKYFTPSATVPTLVSASLGLQNTSVTVVFSEAFSAVTATNASNYSINNGVTVSSATVVNSSTVLLTTSPITTGNPTLTASGISDWAGNVNASSQIAITGVASDVVRLQDSSANHLLVLEAEDFSLNLSPSPDGYSWVFTPTPTYLTPTDANITYSGTGVMEAQPNTGVNRGSTVTYPELDYKVYFSTTGTNYSWVRGVGDSAPGPSANDSVFIGIDGTATTGWTGFPLGAGYAWGNANAGGLSDPIIVTTPGYHVINVWMREDGFAFDKLVLSSNPSFNPTGIGPAESSAILLPVTVTHAGGSLSIIWSGASILQSANVVTGPWTDVAGATSPYVVTPTGLQKFYRVRN
jgi:hypothetical protein